MRVLAHLFAALLMPVTRVRLVLVRYAVFLVFAAVLVAPLNVLLDRSLAFSTSLDRLDGDFVERVWVDLADTEAGALADFRRSGSWVLLLGLVFGWTVLSAGTMWVLAVPGRRSSVGEFLRGVGRWWRPFVRLVPFLIAGWLVIWLVNRGLTWAVNLLLVDAMRRQASSGALGFVMHAKTLLCLVLVGWWSVVIGLARARAVLDRDRAMWRCVWRSCRLTCRRPLHGALLALIGPGLLAAVLVLYAAARDALPDGPLVLGSRLELSHSGAYLLVSQVCALLLQGVAVVWAATFLRTYRELCPAAPPPEPEPLAPPYTIVDSVVTVLPILVLVGAAAAAQDSALPRGPFPAQYRIHATLLPDVQQVRGRMTLHFQNLQDAPVTELPFHLYPNAFAHSRSVWMQELDRSLGDSYIGSMDAEQAQAKLAYCHVESVRIDDVEVESALHDTVMTVPLALPLMPGDALDVELAFVTRLPETIARMGRVGDHFDVMQWYPKLGVHGPEGWDCRPFHASTEFFADFGDYDVTLVVPERFVVGATGEAAEVVDGTVPAGHRAERYVARAVHDFAWCADPYFREQTDTYSYGDHEVRIRYLYQPYAEAKVEDVLAATKKGLERYGEWFLPYPYGTLTIDGLPYGLGGGMEYPTLFTISQGFPNHWPVLAGGTEAPVGVTLHEFGHQYWYGILASDEFTEAWLDEGVNVYVTTRLEQEFWGEHPGRPLPSLEWRSILRPFLNEGVSLDLGFATPGLVHLIGFEQSPFTRLRPGREGGSTLFGFPWPEGRGPGRHVDRYARRKSDYDAIAHHSDLRTPSYRMHPDAYGPSVYSKTALSLATLENVFGWEAVRDGLRRYVERHKFTHPRGEDLLNALAEAMPPRAAEHWQQLGRDDAPWPVEPFLTTFFRSNETVDFAVTRVQRVTAVQDRGYVPADRAASAPTFRPPGDEPGPPYACRVLVENLGSARLPVDVRLDFEDGSQQWRTWDGQDGFRWFELESAARLVSATADPDGHYLLDRNSNNNGRRVERHTSAVRLHQELSVYWAQVALAALSLLGGP